ncbi:putative ATP-dependent DNA helicase HFM1 [Vanrija pseudolonga]|uniref:DNA 3'-5' helicase n=1 Tax=Vanrija pseudolonga TaxID=143232 RepID=A0AAF1BQ96_9TREE|nr:putative ATP-dependent DNA helicase HFM1 [Vanrija pseudolonga]
MSSVDDLLNRLDARNRRPHGAAPAHSTFARPQPPPRTTALYADAFSPHDAFSTHDAFSAPRREEFAAPVMPGFGDQEPTPSSKQFVGPTFDDGDSPTYPAQQAPLRRLSAQHAAVPHAQSSSPISFNSGHHHVPQPHVGPLPPSPDSPYGQDATLRATTLSDAHERKPSLAQIAQPKAEAEEEDEFGLADNDEWMSQAVAEATKVEAARPVSRTGTASPYFQKPAAQGDSAILRPPSRVRTASPYFHQPAIAARPPSAQLRPPSRLTSASPSTLNVRFPKLPSRPTSAASTTRGTPPPRLERSGKALAQKPTTSARANGGGVAKGVQLVSVHALDTQAERDLFNFEYFNEMQSAVFHAAYKEDENLVVTAPTGSGKTTVFELAFLHMISERTERYNPLAIYMAPTKALCSERVQDWKHRFRALDINCVELTGDTEAHDIHRYLDNAHLIVTTPEKWDSVTRRTTIGMIIDRLTLMMIDEVHILNESRGATLEVVVSRMKERSSSKVRFVAVSASVPNIDDVARWIGTRPRSDQIPEDPTDVESMSKAEIFKFGEEFRPVPLTRHVIGYEAHNDFALGSKLDKELFPLLNRHSQGKPVLIFCPTRRACHITAETVFQEYKATRDAKKPLPWDNTYNKSIPLKDSKITALTECGIAVHHGGLELLDRRKIEDAFKAGDLHLIVYLTHLVIIKGTSMWQGSGHREYTDIDIQQMMGRAGRPQFDNSGTVVVLCDRQKLARYQDMVHAKVLLESCLHEHLTEHLNSEIGLGTIKSLKSAQDWLRRSFLFIRIQQNHRHYQKSFAKDHAKTWTETLDIHVENALRDLQEHELVGYNDEDDEEDNHLKGLVPTSLGRIMSRNFISYTTMCHIVSMRPDSEFRDLLEILAGAKEFDTLRIRQGEASFLNSMRETDGMRYKLGDSVKSYGDKVFIHLQITFGNIDVEKAATKSENNTPLQTQITIFSSAPRIAKAMMMVATEKEYGPASRAALSLLRTVNGKAWEDSTSIFRQIERIGPKSLEVLKNNGIRNWDQFLSIEPDRLELWFNRNHPFGHDLKERAREFPRFKIEFTLVARDTCTRLLIHASDADILDKGDGQPSVQLHLKITNTGALINKVNTGTRGGRGRGKDRNVTYNLSILFVTSRDDRFLRYMSLNTGRLKDKERTPMIEVQMLYPDEKIIAIAGVDEKSGLAQTFEFDPRIPEEMFKVSREATPVVVINDKTPSPEPRRRSGHQGSSSRLNQAKAEPDDDSRGGRGVKLPLFLQAPLDIESSEDELIDLTAEPTTSSKQKLPKRPARRSPPSKKRSKPRSKRPRLARSRFIDDMAEESDGDDDEEDDEDESDGLDLEEYLSALPRRRQSPPPVAQNKSKTKPIPSGVDSATPPASFSLSAKPAPKLPIMSFESITPKAATAGAFAQASAPASPPQAPPQQPAAPVTPSTPHVTDEEDFDSWMASVLGD